MLHLQINFPIKTCFKTAAVLAVFYCLLPAVTIAQTFNPTPEQIERFRNMSPAQQEAIAQSLGVDVSAIRGAISNQKSGNDGSSNEAITRNRGQAVDDTELTRPDSTLDDQFAKGQELEDTEELGDFKDVTDLPIFGADLFDLGTDNLQPAANVPVPQNYLLGPGDAVRIQLFGKQNSEQLLEIDRDGAIAFPGLGPVFVGGMSFSQAQKHIRTIVDEKMIGTTVAISLASLRTIRVFVVGDVKIPGSYVVSALSTITNAIAASGGVKDSGSLRNIQLKRGGKLVSRLDLYDLMLKGDTRQDRRLSPGDVILVPAAGPMVAVQGAVKRAARYELKNETSVKDVLTLAGGATEAAYFPGSRISRVTKSGMRTFIPLRDQASDLNRSVQGEDRIQLARSNEVLRDVIYLKGYFVRNDEYPWRAGLRFSDIMPSFGDLKQGTDTRVGLIARESIGSGLLKALLFSPSDAIKQSGTNADPILTPRDSVWLFDYASNRDIILSELVTQLELQAGFEQREQTVDIAGSVRFPGEYPLAKSMTARDLIALAGGLTENSSGANAEITRYRLDDQLEGRVSHLAVNLTNDNPVLLPSDSLRIQQLPNWMQRESVLIEGEVMHPGRYAILPGETLLDVLRRAGGVTPLAYPDGAVFTREELRELEENQLARLRQKIEADILTANIEKTNSNQNTGIDSAETDRILENLARSEAVGRMVIDLERIFSKPKRFDFPLVDGDTLTIPKYQPSITVVGEVQFPTSHFFDDELSYKDYLELSGGTKEKADKKRIYIVKASGAVVVPRRNRWFASRTERIEPGDTIVVPLDADRADSLAVWGSVTEIMYRAALGVAAVNSL